MIDISFVLRVSSDCSEENWDEHSPIVLWREMEIIVSGVSIEEEVRREREIFHENVCGEERKRIVSVEERGERRI